MKLDSKIDFIKTLEYFEGDLLNHILVDGQDYVELWVDVADKNSFPWSLVYLVYPASSQIINDYWDQKVDMATLFQGSDKYFLVTYHGDKVLTVDEHTKETLPKNYHPRTGVFHSTSLRPENY